LIGTIHQVQWSIIKGLSSATFCIRLRRMMAKHASYIICVTDIMIYK
jgi:hypothetical protein